MTKETKAKEGKKKDKDVTGSRKARTGLPQVNMLDAIDYVKKAFDTIGTNLKSFSGMAQAMGITEAFGKRAFGELKDYGLIEQEGTGWRIADLGRRAVNGEKSAVIELLEKNSILKTLFSELKDKKYDRDYVEDYIKKKRFAYNINISLVADRFIAALDYIRNLEEGGNVIGTDVKKKPLGAAPSSLLLNIVKLKFALNPPSKTEIKALVQELSTQVTENDDIAIKSITAQMLHKKDNEAVLNALLESLIHIISESNPSFSLETAKEEEKHKQDD